MMRRKPPSAAMPYLTAYFVGLAILIIIRGCL